MVDNREDIPDNIAPKDDSNSSLSVHKVVYRLFQGDGFVWAAVAILMALSVAVIVSSTASLVHVDVDYEGKPLYFLMRRLRDVGLGLLVILIVHNINITKFFDYIKWGFWLCIGLMLLTNLGVGENINSATRTLGPIQPSDFLKIAMILMLASQLTRYRLYLPKVTLIPMRYISFRFFGQKNISAEAYQEIQEQAEEEFYIWYKYSLPMLGVIMLSFIMIVDSNLSTAVLVFVIGMAMLLMGGVRARVIVLPAITIGGIGTFLLLIASWVGLLGRSTTWFNRLVNHFTGAEDHQSDMAMIAIARGIVPRGIGGSLQRTTLPRSESDFIFAFMIEELGIFVAIIMCLFYVWIFHRAVRIARAHDNRFEALACVGLAFFLVFQAAVHMLVNVGIVPVTGLVLPFMSHGGSAIVSMSIAVGIILNISTHIDKNKLKRR